MGIADLSLRRMKTKINTKKFCNKICFVVNSVTEKIYYLETTNCPVNSFKTYNNTVNYGLKRYKTSSYKLLVVFIVRGLCYYNSAVYKTKTY